MKQFKEVVLEIELVKLVPLELEHQAALLAAESDGNLWELWFTSIPNAVTVKTLIEKAIDDLRFDKGLGFAAIDKQQGTIIGSTRYANATPEHKRLEIGYIWYAKSYQKTYGNTECKFLLLQYAFEELKLAERKAPLFTFWA